MPFVVTENCIKCKYTDCVEVCPVDCFHEGPNFLVIDRRPNSRLSCQIVLKKELDGLVVRVADEQI